MARPTATESRRRRSQESDDNLQPPPRRSRKRNAVPEEEDSKKGLLQEEGGHGEEEQPRRLKQSRSSEDGSGGGGSSSGGGSGSGSGGGGSGSGSRRRSSGFVNISTQGNEEEEDDDRDDDERFAFSESQTSARSKMVKSAKTASKEVQIEEKDQKKGNELSDLAKKDLIKKMMRFLLMKGLNHEPLTRKEVMDNVLGEKYRKAGVLKFILTKADEKLQQGMGFKVKTPLPDKPWFVKDTFYVVNVLNNEQHSKEVLKGKGQAGRGLLVLVLSVIFCSSDKSVAENQLFKKLHDHVDKRVPEKAWNGSNPKNKVRVHVDGLGDVHEHLAIFAKQHYLLKKMVDKPTADGGTESIPHYSIGPRSVLEIGHRQLVELMAKVMGQSMDPSDLLGLEEQESQGLSQMATQEH
ncbi:unnamed protein product [Ectocarpus sp. 4 AP-2014]